MSKLSPGRVLLLLLSLGATACASEPEPDPPDAVRPAPEAAAPSAPPLVEETFAPAAPPSDSVWVGDPPTRVPGPYKTLPDGWTTGTVDLARPEAATGVLRALRIARQEGYDRTVFEFSGPVPGVHTEYVDTPVYTCGAGEPLRLAGDGWLRVSFQPAQAHTDDGRPTVAERRQQPALPVVRELAMTCDFEGEVTTVLGVAAPNGYRLLELSDPPRLVVDVRH